MAIPRSQVPQTLLVLSRIKAINTTSTSEDTGCHTISSVAGPWFPSRGSRSTLGVTCHLPQFSD